MRFLLCKLLIFPPILLGVFIVAMGIAARRSPERGPTDKPVRPVTVITLQQRQAQPRVVGYGLAQPGRIWRAVARVAGTVVESHPNLKSGATIPAGELLVQIDRTDYELQIDQLSANSDALNAQIAELESSRKNDQATLKLEQQSLALFQKELDRQKQLRTRNATSTTAVEFAERELLRQQRSVQSLTNSLNLVPAKLDRLRAELVAVEKQLEAARRDLERTVIRAPFDCRLAAVNIENGQYVAAREQLFEVHGVKKMEVEARLPIDDLQKLVPTPQSCETAPAELPTIEELVQGLSAKVRVRSGSYVREWPAELVRIRERVDRRTRTLGVVVAVGQRENAERRQQPLLLEGTFCEVEFQGQARDNQFMVPVTAVRNGQLFVVNGDNRLEVRTVEPVLTVDDEVVVQGSLRLGDQVVVSKVASADIGLEVEPTEEQAESRSVAAETGSMISFFAKHPTAANLLMMALLAMGILSLRGLRRETFPDFQPREVEIRVAYPGATAEEVEEGICQRIEDAIDGVRFVEEVLSDARENMGVVTVEMLEDGEWSAFKDEIDTAIAGIDDFPDRAEEPIVQELHTTQLVMTVLVAGDMSQGDLKLYAEGLKDRMQEIPEVNLVRIAGFSDHQLRVELSAQSLIRHGLSPADVADAIRRQSLDVPAGTVESTREEVRIRFTEERQTAESLGNLVVLGGATGAEIRVRDLGQVVDDFERAEDKAILYRVGDDSGMAPKRAALLQVEKTDTQDSMTVAAAVQKFLDQERHDRPAIDLIVTRDMSSLVSDRLGLLLKNGFQGILLVFATMWLFFNARLSFWVAASLPVSFLGAFYFIPQFDITINMMSMVGLLLGIGILMDDGIVIAENIAAHRERGSSPLRAAVDGVRGVSAGVFSSFLTTICVLGPLAFLQGNIGRVLKVVPIVLLLVLTISLIEAFLILPHHLAHSMQTQRERHRIRDRFDAGFAWVRTHVLGRTVDVLVRWRYAWIGCVVLVFSISVALPASGILQFQALPELEGDTAVVRVLMPQGTPLEQTEKVVERLVQSLNRLDDQLTPGQPDGQRLVKNIYARYNENMDAFESGPHVVTIYADLLGAQTRSIDLEKLFSKWREEAGVFPDALAVNFTDPSPAPTGRNIEVRVRGRQLDELRALTLDVRDWLGGFDGVENLTTDLRPGKREYHIRFRPGVLGLELDSSRMANQLRAAFQGQQVAEMQVGAESYEIEVRFDRESRNSISDLVGFRFTLADGTQVPLATVATVEEAQSWSRIARINRVRTATLRGDVDSTRSNTAAVLAALSSEYLPGIVEQHPDVSIELAGETSETAVTGKSLARGMLVGVIGVFILLSFQFRSYIEPLIVMAAIPFALIGVIWGHLIMGYPITMPSMLGYVSLAGVVVNDSILLVLFLKEARRGGKPPQEAAGQASRQRFRAILMTSLTTMAGLIPLTFETSLQALILIPLAVSIVFGMFASTILVLLVIPCLYVVLDDIGLTARLDDEEETTEQDSKGT